MRHSQIFDKTNSFLKTILNIFILRNLIHGVIILNQTKLNITSPCLILGGEVAIKEKAGILHQIYRFRGVVTSWGNKIYLNKTWYYSGPFQTSKVELFAKNSNLDF